MTSIFDLKTSVQELSSANEGTSKMVYEQHPPTRDCTNTNFPNGAQHIRWEASGQKWWIPSRSYLRYRLKLTKADGTTPLEVSDDVAINMGTCANLYQSAEFRINDNTVSRVSDYMPQIDALETRLSKSRAWLEGLGSSTNWWQDDFKERQAQVTSDASDNGGDPVQTARSGAGGLGYDAATNTYEVKTNLIEMKVAGGTDLVVGAFNVGDKFKIIGGAGDLSEYEILAIVADTIALQQYTIQIGSETRGVGTGDFARVRREGSSRKVSEFEVVWQPPLSIFKIGHAMPGGRYELVLNPQTVSQFELRAIESLNVDHAVAGGFKLSVVDMYLYVATVDGPRADNLTYLLDLEETRCQVDSVSNGSFTQKNFDVSPSTYALTCAFQDTTAGTDTRNSASKFKVANVANNELLLNRLFINYAGQNRPAPDAAPDFDTNKDYTVQRYVDSQLYSGAFFDTGSGESIDEYHNRGAYYYFSWPRDGTDRSTRVNVHFGWRTDPVSARILLFDHSKKVARIQITDGRVVDVQVEDA